MSRDNDFDFMNVLSEPDDDMLEEISETSPFLDKSAKKRITALCEEKLDMKNDDFKKELIVDEPVEIAKKRPWYRHPAFSAAAAMALVAGIAGGVIISRGGSSEGAELDGDTEFVAANVDEPAAGEEDSMSGSEDQPAAEEENAEQPVFDHDVPNEEEDQLVPEIEDISNMNSNNWDDCYITLEMPEDDEQIFDVEWSVTNHGDLWQDGFFDDSEDHDCDWERSTWCISNADLMKKPGDEEGEIAVVIKTISIEEIMKAMPDVTGKVYVEFRLTEPIGDGEEDYDKYSMMGAYIVDLEDGTYETLIDKLNFPTIEPQMPCR